ncbi:MAG: TRAP transporter substrate-binding protein DctP [Chloroflexi bacterium]|nr:TRAP transporter substrate-binding protein DctP [Chloroflexota bacterium]
MRRRTLVILVACLTLVALTLAIACAKPTPAPKPAPTVTVTAPGPTVTATATPAFKPIELKMTTYASAKEFTTLLFEEMGKRITTRTNGAVTFKVHVGGQLGGAKEVLPLARDGTADIAIFGEGYYPGEFPLTGVAVLPYTGQFGDIKARQFLQIIKEFPEIEKEFSGKGVKLLIPGQSADPIIVMKSKKIQNMADFKGLKIRTAGNDAALMEAWGGTPVGLVYADIYDALSKGTIDGSFSMPIWSYPPVGLHEVGKYYIQPKTGNTFSLYIVMNQNSYNKLQPEVQKILDEEALRATNELWATVAMGILREALGKAAAVAGNEFYALSDDVLKQMKDASMTKVHAKWIDDTAKATGIARDRLEKMVSRWIELNNQAQAQTKLINFDELYQKEFAKK